MILTFQQEMENPERPVVIEKAYEISRRFLTEELSRAVPGHEGDLYAALVGLWHKNPVKFIGGKTPGGGLFHYDRTLEVGRDEVGYDQTADRMYEAMREHGMNKKHPIDVDANLIATLRLVAHEGAH